MRDAPREPGATLDFIRVSAIPPTAMSDIPTLRRILADNKTIAVALP